jgi:valyl-tRNA synthetase
MLDKSYDAASVEPRISAAWEAAGAFRAGAGAKPGARPYSIVIPPPNVTGSLHIGHALNNTLQDILVRFERMRGRDVLWQPGMDHAGIATQMVVERQMMERQEKSRREIGREKFLEKVWTWKAESGGAIISQLKRLGASCDWSRERFTMGERGAADEQMVRAVTKAFVDLHRAGLIYKDKRLVNWDPQLQTAISDLEVVQVETRGHLWHFRYPIEGRTFDPNDRSTFITVATTRPETMLGDTGIAVHPDDERYKELVGKYAILPLVGRRLRIVADAYADPATGSGAVKITPAHDFNDFEVGKRQGLRAINVMNSFADISIEENLQFWEDTPFAQEAGGADEIRSILGGYPGESDEYVRYHLDNRQLDELRMLGNLGRFTARERVVALMDERGFFEKVEDHVHSVPQGDRSGVPIEPRLTDQWYVDAETLAKRAIDAVRQGRTVLVPKTWEKTYFDWMENIQPWCISRQLWWGHQIPVWYGPEAEVFCELTEAEAKAAAAKRYDRPVEVVEMNELRSRILLASAWDSDDGESRFEGDVVPLARDPDVLDTWFSSALWPFSTLGWPDATPELARYYPTSALVTGFDIIFFWVARMMMMGLHFMPDVPFADVYIHALVRDDKGAKMSKSKGNVIDPIQLIDEYGADALRFTLAAMAAQGRDIKLSPARVEGYRNFATKIWNAAKFAEHYGCRPQSGFDPSSAKETLNRWIATETARATAAVTGALEAYKFNEAAAALYRFVWNLTCDWYLELAKPVLNGEEGPAKAETRATVAFVLDAIVGLLHPFMPFITEELWAWAGEATRPVLALSPWPTHEFIDAPAADEINWLIELIAAIRSVRSEMNVPPAAMVPLSVSGASPATAERLKTHDVAIRRLARIQSIALAGEPLRGAVQILLGEATLSLSLAGIVDLDAESARLRKEVDKADREIAKIDAKLGNAQFMAKAPEEVVEEQRERRAEAAASKARTEAAIARLNR